MRLEFSEHASDALLDRRIDRQWIERTVANPASRETDPSDPALERCYGPIQEREDRVLRLVANTRADPWRMVTVFFDHKRRGTR